MRASLEFVERSLAAIQGGNPLPPDIARRWIQALQAVRVDPLARLDDVLCIRPGTGESSICAQYRRKKRASLVQQHFAAYHEGESLHAASQAMEDNLQLLRKNRNDPNVLEHYRTLFEDLAALGVRIPGQRTICNEIGGFVTNRF